MQKKQPGNVIFSIIKAIINKIYKKIKFMY